MALAFSRLFLRIEALNCERGKVRNYRFTMTSGRQGVFEYESPRVGIDILRPRSRDNDGSSSDCIRKKYPKNFTYSRRKE